MNSLWFVWHFFSNNSQFVALWVYEQPKYEMSFFKYLIVLGYVPHYIYLYAMVKPVYTLLKTVLSS